jgi:predicted MFS family arabinose efflux permease
VFSFFREDRTLISRFATKINPWSGLRGLPRLAWWLALATLINRAGTMVLPFLLLYLTRCLGWETQSAAWILVVYGTCSMIAGPVSGRLCDRYGSGRVLCVSLASSSAVLLVFPYAQSRPTVTCLTVLLSLCGESFRPASLAIQAQILPPELRKRGFALNRLAVNLGVSVGPALGGVLAGLWFPAIFIMDGLSALLASLLLVKLVWSFQAEAVQRPPEEKSGTPWADRNYLFFLAGTFLVGLGFFQVDSTMPLTMIEGLGMTERDFGLIFTINTLMIVLLEVAINDGMARWNTRRTLLIGAVLVGTGFGGMSLVREFQGIAVTVAVWTVGEMVLFPTLAVRATELAPEGQVGAYMGMMTSCFGLAFAAGPALGVALYSSLGQVCFWPIVFCVCCLGGVLLSRETI